MSRTLGRRRPPSRGGTLGPLCRYSKGGLPEALYGTLSRLPCRCHGLSVTQPVLPRAFRPTSLLVLAWTEELACPVEDREQGAGIRQAGQARVVGHQQRSGCIVKSDVRRIGPWWNFRAAWSLCRSGEKRCLGSVRGQHGNLTGAGQAYIQH